jgi:hypothetical protein
VAAALLIAPFIGSTWVAALGETDSPPRTDVRWTSAA